MNSSTIRLELNKEDLIEYLIKHMNGDKNLFDLIRSFITVSFKNTLQNQFDNILLKHVRVENTYANNKHFITLKTLSETGLSVHGMKILLITALDKPLKFELAASGCLKNTNNIDCKVVKLKSQCNHQIKIKEIQVSKEYFADALQIIKNANSLKQPYIANYHAGGLYVQNCPKFINFIAFDHLLTNARIFCECARECHTIVKNQIKNDSNIYNGFIHISVSLPDDLKIIDNPTYKHGICHLCIAKNQGHQAAIKQYGDSIFTHYNSYMGQLLVTTINLDVRSAKTKIQKLLEIDNVKPVVIELKINKNELVEYVVNGLSGNVNLFDFITSFVKKNIIKSFDLALPKPLLKPIQISNQNGSNYDFSTLKDLADNGFSLHYFTITFATNLAHIIPNIKFIFEGWDIEMQNESHKINRLATRANHQICFLSVNIDKNYFENALGELKMINFLEKPYIANYKAGSFFLSNPPLEINCISFDHLLTNERIFCECSRFLHSLIKKEAEDKCRNYTANLWSHSAISLLRNAIYKPAMCHLCIASEHGAISAITQYVDSIFSNYESYIGQVRKISNLNQRSARAKIQNLLGIQKWKRELLLHNLIKDIFSPYEIVAQASLPWLGRQTFDIYIPELKLAIEHHGKQHYEAVDFFGGEDAFKRNLLRDERKINACLVNGVDLIVIKYNESLTLNNIRNKLKKYLPTINK